MQILAKLVSHWQSEGLTLFAPEAADRVREVFAGVGWNATSDVLLLYASLGGMEEMDKEYWRMWPLQDIESENSEPSRSGVLFSDYLMGCWCYRLRPNADDTSAVLVDYFDEKEPTIVANTLEQFLEAYAVNATLLLDARSLVQAQSSDA
jgi:hypothetical protein